MPKLTWKEATLNYIKELVEKNDTTTFSLQELADYRLGAITIDVRSRSKNPKPLLSKTLKELCDFKILRTTDEPNVYKYIPNHDNEELIYKEKRSIGHIRVVKCLSRLGIKYEEEKTFSDMKHKSYLRLDVYFEFCGHRAAIEYDGIQHQKEIECWGGSEGLTDTQKRDWEKTSYCYDNHILLLRITHDTKDIEEQVVNFVHYITMSQLAKTLLAIFTYLYQKIEWHRKCIERFKITNFNNSICMNMN